MKQEEVNAFKFQFDEAVATGTSVCYHPRKKKKRNDILQQPSNIHYKKNKELHSIVSTRKQAATKTEMMLLY